eukprot:1789252-Rhodomonas_salina.10
MSVGRYSTDIVRFLARAICWVGTGIARKIGFGQYECISEDTTGAYGHIWEDMLCLCDDTTRQIGDSPDKAASSTTACAMSVPDIA